MVEVTAPQPDRVCFAYDAGAVGGPRPGRVEVRLRTPQTAQVLELAGAVD